MVKAKDTAKAMANREIRATKAKIPVMMVGAKAQASIEGVFWGSWVEQEITGRLALLCLQVFRRTSLEANLFHRALRKSWTVDYSANCLATMDTSGSRLALT
jgi:hypothetical protein